MTKEKITKNLESIHLRMSKLSDSIYKLQKECQSKELPSVSNKYLNLCISEVEKCLLLLEKE